MIIKKSRRIVSANCAHHICANFGGVCKHCGVEVVQCSCVSDEYADPKDHCRKCKGTGWVQSEPVK